MRASAGPAPERRGFRHLRWAILVVLGLALVSIVGNRGLIRLYHLRQEQAALAREIDQLGAANAALAEEVRALRTDPSRLEAIAREDLGLVKPNELVFQFPSAAAPHPR